MSELHEYRLAYVDRNTKVTAAACVFAYSAEDALTQWRIANPVDTGAGPVFKIEPLHDAPKDPARHEWVTIPIGGLGNPWAAREDVGSSASAAPSEWTTIPVAGRLVTERDRALEDARRFERENVELHAAIFGHAFGSITHEQAVVEAERLRKERDAVVLPAPPEESREQGFTFHTEARLEAQRLTRKLAGAHAELDVQADRLHEARAERDALQRRIDAALQYRSSWTAPTAADAIKAMVAILEGREP